jgi:hypothetical protein
LLEHLRKTPSFDARSKLNGLMFAGFPAAEDIQDSHAVKIDHQMTNMIDDWCESIIVKSYYICHTLAT